MDDRFPIRPAASADLPAIAALERACFSDPWSVQGFGELLATPQVVFLVADRDGDVAGYAVGRAVLAEGELLNLAVAQGARRQGVGDRLLAAVLVALRERGAGEVFLEVRESNLAARRLYERHGFRTVGLRPRYYARPAEDALVMRLALSEVVA